MRVGCGVRGLLLMLTVVGCAAVPSGCGNKGDLYLAKDDPARAERDARGKSDPFPFPPEGAEWPPQRSPAATDSDNAATAQP